MAETVIKQLKQLAQDDGRTIIATIHQPSSGSFALFDKLLLIADGTLTYHDNNANVAEYFKSIGYPCPRFTNPSDHIMRKLSHSEHRTRIESHWLAQVPSIPEEDEHTHLRALFHAYQPLGLVQQVTTLSRRNIKRMVKDKIGFKARLGQNLILSIVCGLIFLQIEDNEYKVMNFNGALFFIAANRVFGDATPEFMIFPSELPIILREYRSGLYYTGAWYFAKNITELPMQILFPFIFLTPVYFMIGFEASAEMYFTFLLIIILLSSTATGFGYFIACVTGNPRVAAILGPVMILPFLLFGGLFLNSNSAPVYFVWLEYLSPIKFGYEAFMRTYWEHQDGGMEVLRMVGMLERETFTSCLILLGLNIGFRTIAGFFLWRYCRKNI